MIAESSEMSCQRMLWLHWILLSQSSWERELKKETVNNNLRVLCYLVAQRKMGSGTMSTGIRRRCILFSLHGYIEWPNTCFNWETNHLKLHFVTMETDIPKYYKNRTHIFCRREREREIIYNFTESKEIWMWQKK